MKLLVLGAAGQLGGAFAGREDLTCVGVTRRDVDVTVHDALMAAVEDQRPDVIVNCTAYNDVDGAEDDVQTALEVNAFAVRSMAAAARRAGATLVHYSTDFVFDGEASTPYAEDDRARPVSVYGASKLLGEWFALDAPRAYVLRVESLFGGPAARSSVDRIVSALREGRTAPVFVDRIVSPSFVEDVVDTTVRLLHVNAAGGVYHCVNRGAATWAEVGSSVAAILGVSPDRLRPTSVRDVTMRARRPVYCALDPTRLETAIGRSMPTWRNALERYLARH